ncbi:hypothetical protein Hanom_Chr09g00788751 [Helianthus anomalus]
MMTKNNPTPFTYKLKHRPPVVGASLTHSSLTSLVNIVCRRNSKPPELRNVAGTERRTTGIFSTRFG